MAEQVYALHILRIICETVVALVLMSYEIVKAIFEFVVPPLPKDVKGEVVLITGAGHGMGREMALRFARLGATVVCVDINPVGNEETHFMIKVEKGKSRRYVCDVTNRAAVFELAQKVRDDVGAVTILVNNAGVMPCKPILQQTENEIRTMNDINVNANLWCIQAFLPGMIENNHGHIVAMSSMAGLCGVRNLVPYCGTKFAVKGIMRALAIELEDYSRSKNIKTTTIFPSIVDTGLCKKPRIKFPSLTNVIKPGMAADAIVDAVRRNYKEVTIPSDFYYINKYFCDLLPYRAWKVLDNFMDTGVDAHD